MKKLIALMLLLGCGSASAIPVTWTLDSVSFSNGDAVSGSFVYDANTNTYSDISIVSNFYGPVTYTGENPLYYDVGGGDPYGPDIDDPLTDFSDTGMTLAAGYTFFGGTYQKELTLAFGTALTNAGGTVALVPAVSNERLYVDVVQDYAESRTLVSGVITAVPIPAAVWLFGSALAGLGWFRRRQAA